MSERLLALIPAFNEQAHVADVVTRALPLVNEVVVVDDGSTDRTGEMARNAGAIVLRHEQNRGKGASLVTGLEYFRQSDAEWAILLDADGQHNPSEIPAFLETARHAGANIVVGSRMRNVANMPRVRLWTNLFTSWLTSKLARQPVSDSQCGYRLVARSVLGDLRLETSRFETETEMLIQAGRAGHRIASQPIQTIYLVGRVSHIHPLRDTARFFNLAKKYWP